MAQRYKDPAVTLWWFCVTVALLVKVAHTDEAIRTRSAISRTESQRDKRPQDIAISFLRGMEKLTRTLYKKSYPASYFNPTPSAYPSYYPYSYPYPASSPYPTEFDGNDVQTDEGTYAGQSVIQTGQYHCITYPSTPGMNRSETFEIRGKRFKSIGCWRDNPDRAIEKLEGKHRLLKDPDYKSRVNALMKCADAALTMSLTMFALQNGGQCFGGKDAEKSFRKYGLSTGCCGDGEGGPWSNEVYSFLGNNGKPIVNASYNPWSPWSPCPQTCQTANQSLVQVRNRTCFNNQSSTAMLQEWCYPNFETRPCVVQTCPVTQAPSTANPTATPPSQSSGLIFLPSPRRPYSVCAAKVELVVLIDGSGSVNRGGLGSFRRTLNVVKRVVNGFEVTNDRVHVGVIIFATGPRVVTGLNEHHYDKISAMEAISGIRYPGGYRHIGRALDFARTKIYHESDRHGHPKMLIVFTRGHSRDSITAPAQRLRDSGVTIFSVGIGSYDSRQLREMATDPDSQHVYIVDFDDPDTLVRLVTSIKYRVCRGSNGKIRAPPPTVCRAKLDLAILIDTSQNAEYFAKRNFRRSLQFIKQFVSGFNIGSGGTHVGIVVFARDAKVVFGFGKYFNMWTMLKAIDNIKYSPRGTFTGKGLEVVRTQLFDKSARQGVPRILLVVTDSASQDNVAQPSKRLRDMGITVFSLGVGKEYNVNQLKVIATDPDHDHVFTSDFSHLHTPLVEKMKHKACTRSGGVLYIRGGGKVKTHFGHVTADGPQNIKMVEDGSYNGEMAGEEEMKQQWGSNQDEKTDLEEEGSMSDQKRKPEEQQWGSNQDEKADIEEEGSMLDQKREPEEQQWGSNQDEKADLEEEGNMSDQERKPEEQQWGSNQDEKADIEEEGNMSDRERKPEEQQWGSNQDEKADLEEEGNMSDRGRKPEEFSRVAEREKKKARKNFGEGLKGNSFLDGPDSTEGQSIVEGERNRIDRHRGGYGMLFLPNGKFVKLKGRSLQRLALMTNGGDIRKWSAGGMFRNSSSIEGMEIASNAVPRQENSERGIGTSKMLEAKENMGKGPDTPSVTFKGEAPSLGSYLPNEEKNMPGESITQKLTGATIRQSRGYATLQRGSPDRVAGTTATLDAMENRGSRGKQDTPEATFKGKAEFSDDYIVNRGKRVSKKKALANDTSERRITGVASGLSASHASHVHDKATDIPINTIGGNSQMFEQWAGSLKAQSSSTSKQSPLSRRNDSLSFTGRRLVKEAAGKVVSRIMDSSAYPKPVALYPLSAKYQAKDVIGGNIPGVVNNVVPAAGPFNQSGNSLSFLGVPDSYIEFPNNGKLDAKNSLSLLAWVLPKQAGPIFNYKTDGWGVNFWMARPRKLFARFVDREERIRLPSIRSTHVKPDKWNFVGAVYDQKSGRASLWINGKLEDDKYVGNISLATNYPVRMGARIGDKRNFRGRISCMQVYDKALNSRQISVAKWKCRPFERVYKGDMKMNSSPHQSETRDLWD